MDGNTVELNLRKIDKDMKFEEIYQTEKIILTEGAIVERLKSEYNLVLDKWINHAGLIYTQPETLESIYGQYIEIGHKYNIPVMIMTPTRKVNNESLMNSRYKQKLEKCMPIFFMLMISTTSINTVPT